MSDERVGRVSDEASEEVLRRVRAEARAVGGDLLAGLPARAKERPEQAFDPRVIDAAVSADDVTFQRLRRELKATGIPIAQWDAAIKAARTRRRAEERQQLASAATDRRRIEETVAVERRRDFERQRAEATAELSPHFAEASFNSIIYRIAPGTVEMEEVARGGPVVTRLAAFSPPIVADLLEYDAPDAKPRRTLGLSLMFEGDVVPSLASVPVADLERMTWPERLCGARAVVAPGRAAREHLRTAIMRCSRAKPQRRYRYTGRVAGEPIYVHSGGAIGVHGPIDGVDVVLDDPASRFEVLLPGSEEELRAALRMAILLFDAEPANVTVPLVGAAFRAPLGESRLTLHVSGRKGLGKSLLAGICSTFFGPRTVSSELTERFPASWADESTAKGVARVLSTCGDAVVVVDDLRISGTRADDALFKRFDQVTRAHFNRSARRILTAESEARTIPPTRCTIVSTGEVLGKGHSTLDRLATVELHERPRVDARLFDAARNGILAQAMGPYIVRSLATPATLPPIGRREAQAAERWGLGQDDRSSAVFGAIALGLEALFGYLAEHGFSAEELKPRKRRAVDIVRDVLHRHAAAVDVEDPARLFCRLVGDALRSGAAHVARITPGGEPAEPHVSPPAWGWRRRLDGWEPLGLRIGRLEDAKGDVLLDPGPALAAARQIAQRDGSTLALDRESLARALRAAGLLARVDEERRTLTVRARIGANLRTPHLAVKIDAFDLEIELNSPSATTTTDAAAAVESPSQPPGRLSVDREF